MYTAASGAFASPQAGNGNSVNVYKEYRITIDHNVLTIERGETLGSITETRSVTLAGSIVGHTFSLQTSAGGNDGYYSPSEFDWIRVTVTP
jgi:hypothetical protein